MHHRLHNVERSIYLDSDTFTHLLRVLNTATSILDGYLTVEIIIFTPTSKAANQDLADEKTESTRAWAEEQLWNSGYLIFLNR